MPAKFNKDDKVRINSRAPRYIIEGLRQRTRTIVQIAHAEHAQGRCYYLGGRGKAFINGWHYPFRAYMLDSAPPDAPNGRPRKHRRNGQNSCSKLLLEPQNANLCPKSPQHGALVTRRSWRGLDYDSQS